jgi:hypothetical protein
VVEDDEVELTTASDGAAAGHLADASEEAKFFDNVGCDATADVAEDEGFAGVKDEDLDWVDAHVYAADDEGFQVLCGSAEGGHEGAGGLLGCEFFVAG